MARRPAIQGAKLLKVASSLKQAQKLSERGLFYADFFKCFYCRLDALILSIR